MSISIRKYVNIASSVATGAAVRQRDLILRILSSNPLIPADAVVEFTDADSVAAYFGTNSQEYAASLAYFGFVSKSATRAKKISFVLATQTAMPGRVYGGVITGLNLTTQIVPVVAGAMAVTLDGVTAQVTGIDLSTVAAFADIAPIVQARVRAASANAAFTGATVSYNATRGRLEITSGVLGSGFVDIAAPTTGTNVAALLRLDAAGRFALSEGSDQQTPVENVQASTQGDNNFASFYFLQSLTLDQAREVAVWNDAENFMYLFIHPVLSSADAQAAYDELGSIGGTSTWLTPLPSEWPQLLPAALLAATDFQRRAANKNYMFQQMANVTPAVTDTNTSNLLDSVRCNYIGSTQTAGQRLDFSQRGVMFGQVADASDINIYVNEIWLKDRFLALLMSLFLAVEGVPGNDSGRAAVETQLLQGIGEGLRNGVISIGKPLNSVQKSFILEQTGDDLAWHQVQNTGFYLTSEVRQETTQSSAVEFYIAYLLIYSKGDLVRRIEGSHILV